MPRTFTPSEASRIASLSRWSRESGAAQAAVGQAGLLARFEREADPDGVLPPPERQRRAENLRKLHMLRLAAKSKAVRAARRAEQQDAAEGGVA